MCLVSPLKWTKHHICFTPDYWIVTCSELVKDTDVEYKDINSSSDDGQIDSLYFWKSIRTKTLFVTLYKAAWSFGNLDWLEKDCLLLIPEYIDVIFHVR